MSNVIGLEKTKSRLEALEAERDAIALKHDMALWEKNEILGVIDAVWARNVFQDKKEACAACQEIHDEIRSRVPVSV